MSNSILSDNSLSFNNASLVVVKQTAATNNGSNITYSTDTPLLRDGNTLFYNTSICVDSSQNIYYSGYYRGNSTVSIYNLTGTLSTLTLPNPGSGTNYTNCIIKYDKFGIAQSWTRFATNSLNNSSGYEIANGVMNKVSIDTSGNIYWVGNYLSNAASFPVYDFTSNNITASTLSIASGNTGIYNTYIIKYNSSGLATGYSYLNTTSTGNVLPFYSYMNGTNLYVCGSYFNNVNIRDIGTAGTTVGTLSGQSTRQGFIAKWISDIFDSVSILNSSTANTTNIPTSITNDNNYLYVSGAYGGTCNAFSFNNGTTINSTSVSLPLTTAARSAYIIRYNINDGTANSFMSMNSTSSTIASSIVSMIVNSETLYVMGIYTGAPILKNFLINNNGTLTNFGLSSTSFSLPSSSSNIGLFVARYNTNTGIPYDFTNIINIGLSITDNFYPMLLNNDQNDNIYISGNYSGTPAILNFYNNNTATVSPFSLPLAITTFDSFIAKYDKNGIAKTYVNLTSSAYQGYFTVDNQGYIYSGGNNYANIYVKDFSTDSSTATVRYTNSALSSDAGYLILWDNNGSVIYTNRPALKSIQEPSDTYDVANKKYVDGTIEYITQSGSAISTEPNIISVLKPDPPSQSATNPILFNSTPCSTTIDSNGIIYVSGTYFGYMSQLFDKSGTLPIELQTTTPGPGMYIAKYSNDGTILGQTVLANCVPGNLTVSANNFLYASGSYNSTSIIYIYDFSNSSTTGLSRASLPAGEKSFVIIWSASGEYNSSSATDSYAVDNYIVPSAKNVSVDSLGNVYSPINNIANTITNLTNDSVDNYSSYGPSIGTYGLFSQVGTKLVGTGTAGTGCYQGASVSVYKNTMAVGGFEDNSQIGATWIFVKGTNGLWSQQGPKLVGSGAATAAGQGTSVSLYEDTLAVGGPNDGATIIGATWIFQRTGTVWTQVGSKLVGSSTTLSLQGISVSLYKDTLAVGGYGDNGNIGATFIFVRDPVNGSWSQQGSKLVGTGTAGSSSQQGLSVSLYENTVAVGGSSDNGNIGATWIFTRTGTTWSQQGSKLVGTGTAGTQSNQGSSVSLYKDTVAIGGSTDNSNRGATWIFTRDPATGTWTQQGSKLVGTGNVSNSNQKSVSLYENLLAVGGETDNTNIGTTWLFKRTGTQWTQIGNKIVGSGASGSAKQGSSVSLYKNILAVGAYNDNSNTGATWVFNNNATGLSKWNPSGLVIGYSQLNNFVTKHIIDKNNNVYCAGYVQSTMGTMAVYNMNSSITNNVSPFSITQTMGGTAIVKWSPSGIAQGYTFIQNATNTIMSIDNNNNLYISGNYYSSAVVPVYNFTGSGTFVTPFSLPASTVQSTFLIKWASDGVANSFTNIVGTYDTGTGLGLTNDNNGSVYLATPYNSISAVPIYNFRANTTTVSSFSLNSNAQGTWITTGSMNNTRTYHQLLKMTDGNVIAIGGATGGLMTTVRCEIYYPSLGRWVTTGSLNTGRIFFGAILIPNGQILVAGGANSNAVSYNASSEIYNPVTSTWTTTGSLNITRGAFSTVSLYNGKILVAGGYNGTSALSSCELYDPYVGSWTTTGSLNYARTEFYASLLPDGNVIAIGGSTDGSTANIIANEIYNVSTGIWTTTALMNYTNGSFSAAILQNSNILLAAGSGSSIASMSYNPSTNNWSSIYGPTTNFITLANGSLLSNGLYLLAGGLLGAGGSSTTLSFLYNPMLNLWTTTGSLNGARNTLISSVNNIVLLNSGQCLITGGRGTSAGIALSSCELYTPNGSSTAIIKWSPGGQVAAYQTLYGTCNNNIVPVDNCLVIDKKGSINYIGSNGTSVDVYNMRLSGQTNAGLSRITINANNPLYSNMPISSTFTKWSRNGETDLSPYAEDFIVGLPDSTNTAGTIKTIFPITNNYNYKVQNNNNTMSLTSKTLTWDGSQWNQ